MMKGVVNVVKFAVLLISSVVLASQTPNVKDLSNDLKACFSDKKPEVNTCVVDFWNGLRPVLVAGVDNGPTLDPLVFDGDVVLPEINTNIKGKMEFFDLKMKGFGEYVVKAATLNTDNMTMTVDLVIPHLNVECRYDFNSSFMLVPVVGSGPFHAVFKDMEGILTLHIDRNEVGGRPCLVKTELDIVPSTFKLNFAQIFGGAEISTVVHELIHDNLDVLYKDIRFNVGDEIANRGLHRVLKGAISQLPPEIFN